MLLNVFFTLILAVLTVIASGQETITGILYSDGKPVSVSIGEGKITGIKKIKRLPEESRDIYIAPGLIDNQVNGFAGVSFTFGGGELTADGVKHATEELWKAGVTTYLPTLTTNSFDVLKKNFTILGKLKDDPALLGSIAGFHLEGPYISPVDGYRGAHPLKYVRKPDWNEFVSLPPGEYVTDEGDTIELTREGMLRYPAQNVLYGSASPLVKGVGNVMKVTGCSLKEAIRMASTNPARLYNLDDRGELAAGKRADIILFRIVDNELIINKTYVSGNLVYYSEDQ